MYRALFNLFFRRLSPERAHGLALALIAAMGEFGPGRALARACFRVGRVGWPTLPAGGGERPGRLDPAASSDDDPAGGGERTDRLDPAASSDDDRAGQAVPAGGGERTDPAGRQLTGRAGRQLFGRDLPGPLGLAAGFDKDAKAVKGLAALGFSFVEVGTVTRFPQPGNPRPRLWRLIDQRALRNAMGFNNAGSTAVARTLRRLRASAGGGDLVVGVNIGKSKVTDPSEAAGDYFVSARRLAKYADYLVVNVSSPNTPGLRDLQAVAALRPILQAARAGADQSLARAGRPGRTPLLVKIAPDLSDADVDAVAALVEELDLDGIVAVNTTVAHDLGAGGLSGPPLRQRGLEVVRRLRGQLGAGRTVMGVGGIASAADIADYLAAGADAVQAYTAFIYQGPAWPARVQRAPARGRAAPGALRKGIRPS